LRTDIVKAAAGAAVGALMAWTGHSFTIDGQMHAFQAQLDRIELRLDKIADVQQKAVSK